MGTFRVLLGHFKSFTCHFQVTKSFLSHLWVIFRSVTHFQVISVHFEPISEPTIVRSERACNNADKINIGHLGSFRGHLRSLQVIYESFPGH